MKPFLNVFREFNEIDLGNSLLLLIAVRSASTRLIVASLYTLPLMVLKSSASARDVDRTAKIASVVAQHFTRPRFCLFCSPLRDDKMI